MKHIVGLSGGIDSQACARWVLNRYPAEDVLITNSTAGQWEDPLTIEHVDWYSANIHPVIRTDAIIADIWETPGFAETKGYNSDDPLTYSLMCQIKGRPPSHQAQFCTKILKLKPFRRWLSQAFSPGGPWEGAEYCIYNGKRRDESEARKSVPFESWDAWFDCQIYCPIADWTKQMCFDYCKAHGERINPLYSMGFNRVGCMPCINIGKEDIVNIEIRRPDAIARVRDHETVTGLTFFAPTVPGLGRHNFIDDVLAWARTKKGGRQGTFDVMFDRPACESKYGLCE
jgi:3'-phosphoadenosine 5'-phosphosulfate sulfotransferase (PAPS reductase)/FAD synthetase